ncbi:MAG: phosphoribosylformylglycinamidine synthase I [Peptococcaceae bacterium]|nr:phosphoribosylformylglycinamidine synthase I [Peptococcaceae bacterium]
MAASYERGVRGLKPRICILQTDGTNCDLETAYACEIAGGIPELVHVNELRERKHRLLDFQLLIIPGGFTYGDDVHSGKILAVELTSFFKDQIREFVQRGRPVLGICNGFQVLVRTGLLPDLDLGNITATLMGNDSGRFECRWVRLKVENSRCVFTSDIAGQTVYYQAAHAEGKFYAVQEVIDKLERNRQVVFRYTDDSGQPTLSYPYNPNGSFNAIAGICDPSGKVLGLMPHPERFVKPTQYPHWRREEISTPHGLYIFKNAIRYAANV